MATHDKLGGDLAFIAGRSRLPLEIQRKGGMQRLDWIISLEDPRGFIQETAAEELYLLLRDIGEHDAYALLEYASDEQLGAIQDLDIWRGNEAQIPRWLAWVDRCLEVNTETALRFIKSTEDDFLQLLLMGEVAIHTKDLELDLVPDELQLIPSPDGMFWFTAPVHSDIAQRLHSLLKLMWAQDMDRMRNICDTARFELKSSVEEGMTRFRNARLSELGFPSPDEALEVFRYVNPKRTRAEIERQVADLAEDEEAPKVQAPTLGGVVQDLAIAGVRPPRLLAAALELLDDERRAMFGQSFTYLVNKVFMALQRDLSETDELPDAARRAAGLTNLGLAWLADEDPERAALLLERVWPQTCFQVGHSLTVELSFQARRLRARAGANRGMFVFGEPDDGMLDAVSAPMPMYLESLDPTSDSPTWRPFATLQEVGIVAARLLDAEAVLTFFEKKLGFSPDALLEAQLAGLSEDDRRLVRLETLLRTAVVNIVLADEVTFEPLDSDRLTAFMKRPATDWAAAAERLVGDGGLVVARFAERALATLTQALGSVALHELDGRYAQELFLVKGE